MNQTHPSAKLNIFNRVHIEYILIFFISIILILSLKGQLSNYADEEKTLQVVVALLPPHMTQEGKGRERKKIIDHLSGIYEEDNIQFFVQPFSNHWSTYLSDYRFDAVATVPLSIDLEGYSSTEYITYNNVVGYHSDIFPGGINSLSDLHGRHVIAFAGASEIIDKLGEHKQYFSTYTEERNQKLHSQLFLARKVDAVIADREIFMEYNRRLRGDSGNKNVKIAGIFPATHYKMVFRRYNDCLAFSESATKERTSFDLNEQPSTSKSYCYYK